MAGDQSEPRAGNSPSYIEKTVYENGAYVTRFFCPICPSSVKRKCDFNRHMRQHTGEGILYCPEPECANKSGFAQKPNLEQHIKSVHLGIRVACPHRWIDADGKKYKCEQTFSDPSSLIRHRSVQHGFDAGDDKETVDDPTPVWMEFPDSKYFRRQKHAPNTRPMLPAALHPSASVYPVPLDAFVADPRAGQSRPRP
ncbi:transcription factor [Ganoderma sinense ZZ0214-1]|uniref:Transcription factor n=1 Tax=Ganoderma sinense ZZ0214-1 TaxID=1077348 RepID=A0A2G8S044_9APHY|nr:transcription factor [Ganoderma sinense ZZ0214-1]